jgi:hypothetical protein
MYGAMKLNSEPTPQRSNIKKIPPENNFYNNIRAIHTRGKVIMSFVGKNPLFYGAQFTYQSFDLPLSVNIRYVHP